MYKENDVNLLEALFSINFKLTKKW